MHLGEDFLALALNGYADLLANLFQFGCYLIKRTGCVLHVRDHHHVKVILHDGLGDVQDIDLFSCQIGTYLCDDSYGVFSYNCDNYLAHMAILRLYQSFYVLQIDNL